MAPSAVSEKTYSARTAKAVRSKFDKLSAYVQKFRTSLRLVRACNPTGVTEDDILTMALAVHVGKRSTMSYDTRTVPLTIWKNHLTFNSLCRYPKYSAARSSECNNSDSSIVENPGVLTGNENGTEEDPLSGAVGG